MLKSLLIKNYALIEELSVPFSSGLVIITGETGAGKSIIIDALSLVLGERASVEAVRTGAEKAVVEAVFDCTGNAKVNDLLRANTLDTADELIARREVSAKGQSRCFLNDSPVTLALLKQAGELLVDLHGQHEHQSLLRVETHCGMLDDFGGLDGMVQEYRTRYQRLKTASQEYAGLRAKEQQLRERRDFSLFQAQEIDAVAPQAGRKSGLKRISAFLRTVNASTVPQVSSTACCMRANVLPMICWSWPGTSCIRLLLSIRSSPKPPTSVPLRKRL